MTAGEHLSDIVSGCGGMRWPRPDRICCCLLSFEILDAGFGERFDWERDVVYSFGP